MLSNKRHKITRVLLIEGAVNLLLCVAKFVVGTLTQSAVVLADALHSLTDLFNNVIALVAMRISHKPPDKSHRYGHQKFEYLAIFMLSVLLVVVAIELVFYAIDNHGRAVEQSRTGLVLLVVAIVVNLLLSRWEAAQARLLNSKLLSADAKHTLSDVLTSVAVLIGWQLATMGFYWLDTLFCFVVAAIVGRLAWQLFQQALPVLVDADITSEIFSPDQLSILIQEFNDIHRVTTIRSRAMGDATIADLTIKVNPQLSVTDAHTLSHAFERRLKEVFGLYDVMIHIEPDSTHH